jgi:hypothetical protein
MKMKMSNVQQGIFNREVIEDLKIENQIPVETSLLNIETFPRRAV